jgi:hypothetical protein
LAKKRKKFEEEEIKMKIKIEVEEEEIKVEVKVEEEIKVEEMRGRFGGRLQLATNSLLPAARRDWLQKTKR